MTQITAIFDACVLHPAPLRDFLMELALTGLFNARWTAEIHEEWINNVLERCPDLTDEHLRTTQNLMDSHVRNCVVTDYEILIPTLKLPEPDVLHVFAAAIRCRANVIVTFILSDFPPQLIAPYNIKAQHPDEFILHLLALDSTTVCQAAHKHRSRLKNPPKTPEQYLKTLRQVGLPQLANQLRELWNSV